MSLLDLVEKMASSLLPVRSRAALPVLSFTLRSSLGPENAETLQEAGEGAGVGHLGKEGLPFEVEDRHAGGGSGKDALSIELPLEQLVIRDPQTGGREALCVVPQPHSLLTREGRTIRMGTRGEVTEPLGLFLLLSPSSSFGVATASGVCTLAIEEEQSDIRGLCFSS